MFGRATPEAVRLPYRKFVKPGVRFVQETITAIDLASSILAKLKGGEVTPNPGRGSCYVEFGDGRIGRVDLDFLTGPKLTSTYHEPSLARRAEKVQFAASRGARWFGL